MRNICGIFSISSGFVIEINVILLGVGLLFSMDLYDHMFGKVVGHMKRGIYMEGMSVRLGILRLISLLMYMLNAVLGILMSRSLTLFRFISYIMLASLSLIMTICVALSRYQYGTDFRYYSDMMIRHFWNVNRCNEIEELFDCCGMHGAIDYIIVNETWSKFACCGLPGCIGCATPFFDYMHAINMEIARDNFVLFFCALIALIFVIAHFMTTDILEDPYDSESSDFDEPETEPQRASKPPEYRKIKLSTRLRGSNESQQSIDL